MHTVGHDAMDVPAHVVIEVRVCIATRLLKGHLHDTPGNEVLSVIGAKEATKGLREA